MDGIGLLGRDDDLVAQNDVTADVDITAGSDARRRLFGRRA